MKANIALLLCICLQLACSMDLEEIPPREVMITENSTKHEPVISNPAKTITRTSGTDRWRLDVPGHFVDVVFKSSGGGANQQIALVREFQQDESIPTLSKDFHPDHRPVSHYQLYVQNSTNSSSTRRPVGAPFEGHCRIGHTYYMDSEVGDYILSSALQFSEPESVIRMFLTWTDLDIRKQIYHLSYNLERDCRVHDFTTSTSGGSFVSSLPNYDCPWAAAVPSPDGTLIALMHHGSSPIESYKVDVEVLIASHDYTPSLFKNRLIFDNVQFEEAIFYHWVDTNRFRIYGGSSAYEISADNFSVLLIPFDRKARSLQKTSSCRVSNDGSTVLVLDRENGNEPRSLPNRHEKPFGIAHP